MSIKCDNLKPLLRNVTIVSSSKNIPVPELAHNLIDLLTFDKLLF